MITTNTMATKGKKIETIDITMEVPVSTADTTGFAIPAVVVVEAKRAVPELPAMAVAVPPPAIIASAHVITGLKSDTVESITAVPTNAAKGMAILSSKLST